MSKEWYVEIGTKLRKTVDSIQDEKLQEAGQKIRKCSDELFTSILDNFESGDAEEKYSIFQKMVDHLVKADQATDYKSAHNHAHSALFQFVDLDALYNETLKKSKGQVEMTLPQESYNKLHNSAVELIHTFLYAARKVFPV